jgi:cell division protein FtsB
MVNIRSILGLASVALLLVTIYEQNQAVNRLKDNTVILKEQIDSLNTEVFNLQDINGRYELSVDYLKEVNPKAGKQFEDYLNNETE